MGLGNMGLQGFKPQRSATAANLTEIKVISSSKEENLNFRLNGDLYIAFKELCALNETTVSKALRKYMLDAVNQGTL